MNQAEIKNKFLKNLTYTVSIYVVLYGGYYFYLGATAAFAILVGMGFVFVPTCLVLLKLKHFTTARFLFLLSCVSYVVVTPACFVEDIKSEYFLLAAMLLSCTIFETREKLKITVATVVPLLGWAFTFSGTKIPIELFSIGSGETLRFVRVTNFLGAASVVGIFIRLYIGYAEEMDRTNRLSEEEMRLLFNSLPVGVLRQNQDDVIVKMNPAAPLALGLTEDQMMGRASVDPRWKCVNEDMSAMSPAELPSMKTLKSGKPVSNQTLGVHRPDGSLRWLSVSSIPLFKNISDEKREVIVIFNDVTELVEKNKIIEEREKFTNNIVSEIPYFISYVDRDYKYRFLSKQYEREFKQPVTGFLGKTVAEVIGQSHFGEIKERIAKTMSGVPQTFEIVRPAATGKPRVFSCTYLPDYDDNQKVRGVFGIVNDVTKSREDQADLDEVLSAINKSAIVAITDKKGKIVEVNEMFCQLTGYTRNELIGQDHRLINSGVHSKDFFSRMWKTILSGQTWTGEIENKTKTGTHYIVQTVISPLRNASGEIDRFLSIRFDVTLLKETERLLEEAQGVAKLGSWNFDPKHHEFWWSKQMYEHFNLSWENGPPTLEEQVQRIHPDDRAVWLSNFKACMYEAKSFKFRFRVLANEGFIWTEAVAHARSNEAGRVTWISGTCQDVNDIVVAEDLTKRERARALQNSKLASLGEMAAGVAHEINNPLAIISAATTLLPKIAAHPDKVQSKVEAIQKATERIVRIVNGLRKFSRTSELGKREPSILAKIVDESILMSEIKAKRFSTEIIFENRCQAQILCDDIEIEQVLINLIANAVDAVKDLPERWVKIVLFEFDDEVVLQIKDSGRGISKTVVDKIFEPFFTTKPVGEGTGLGLSIVKGILDAHGAQIEVLTDDPHTCFELRFNLAKEG